MKSRSPFSPKPAGWPWAALLGAGVTAARLSAADAPAPQPEATNAPPAATHAPTAAAPAPALTPEQMFEGGTNSYANWIDITAGGFIPSGNKAQMEQWQHSRNGAFGGIGDFHLQQGLAKNTTLTADGHALFDLHDYLLNLGVKRDSLGFLRFSYNEFRTWSNDAGGFYPPTGAWYGSSGNARALDRGQFSIEGGLTLDKVPKVTFKYTHSFRDGEKGSTEWGLTHPAAGVAQGLSASFYDLNERSDSFQLDATHHIKKTDLGLGLRYEHGQLNDALKIVQGPGEPLQQRITDRQDTSYDLFNAHAFTETWFKQTLMFSSGFSYSDLDNDFTGSRIYGSDFDVRYVPNALYGSGYTNLVGGSHLREYVMDLNLLAVPWKNVTVTPSVRVQKEDTTADFTGYQTLGGYGAPFFSGNSDRGLLDVRERLDVRYTGITNWVLYARGEWEEADGNLNEFGGLGQVNGLGVPAIARRTDDRQLSQKYSAGARWYPARRVSVDFGGYYKKNHYDYSHPLDSTPNNSANRYPAYLVMQDFDTYDGNVRLTYRPRPNVSVMGRYEYQWSTIQTEPDPISGLGTAESAKMFSHILAVNLSWSPWSRLYLQPGFNYVVSKTQTPVSDYTPAGLTAAPVLAAQNNYWTVNFNSGFVVDDKTDLNVNYFYYRADNYTDNSAVGVPYGAGAEEHGVTAGIVRRLTKNVVLSLKYGYSRYTDQSFGGHDNFEAHLVYASLRYRF